MKQEVVAVLISDIHLSHTRPICYAKDLDWYEHMAFYLGQLDKAAKSYSVPIVCAGDVFDKWSSVPELINFACNYLPQMHAIPGQHDLPNHNIGELGRSAYMTMCLTENIFPLQEGWEGHGFFDTHAYPWGAEFKPYWDIKEGSVKEEERPQLVVAHKYIWTSLSTSYPGAPLTHKLGGFTGFLKHFDAALFGDNHKGFLANAAGCNVLNNGAMMRRKSDELNYIPHYGVLFKNGTIARIPFDTSQDRFDPDVMDAIKNDKTDFSFIEELRNLGEGGINFEQRLRDIMNELGTTKKVRQIILKHLEE